MTVLFPVPILIFALLALIFLFFSRQASGLKAVLVASYCGVYIISFTGGASGGIWLAPLFLFLIGIVVIWRSKGQMFGATRAVQLTHAMFVIFLFGIVVALIRYDPSIVFIKAGSFRTVLGIPINWLMMIYRIQTVAFLYLAFTLPLRYYIDRHLFLQCLKLCWFFTVFLAVSTVVDYFGIAGMTFNVREFEGYGHLGIMGFGRVGTGLMLYTGIIMSFAMTQLTKSRLLKIVAYSSAPLLILALLFTWSRAIQMAMMVTSISLIFTLGGTQALKGIMVTIIGAIIINIALSHFPDVRERLAFFLGGQSAIAAFPGRLQGWTDLTKWLLKSPGVLLFGVGFQNFHYFVHLQQAVVQLEAAHNNFLHILTEFGIAGFLLFIGWLASIFLWLISWRREMTGKVNRMIPGIFISYMIGMAVSCLTQESLAPSLGMGVALLFFLLILGIWISYYRTQMMKLSGMLEAEYWDYEEAQVREPELCVDS